MHRHHLGDIMGARMETLRRWMRKAVECMDEEKKLKEEMPEHCKKILQKKRLVLFGDLIREVGHEDGDVHMEVAKGFDLSAPIPRSGGLQEEEETRKPWASRIEASCRDGEKSNRGIL